MHHLLLCQKGPESDGPLEHLNVTYFTERVSVC